MPDESAVKTVTVTQEKDKSFTVQPDNPSFAKATCKTGDQVEAILRSVFQYPYAKPSAPAPVAASAPKKRKKR